MNQQENWLIQIHFIWVAIVMVINSFVAMWARTQLLRQRRFQETRHKPTAGWHAWFKNHNATINCTKHNITVGFQLKAMSKRCGHIASY